MPRAVPLAQLLRRLPIRPELAVAHAGRVPGRALIPNADVHADRWRPCGARQTRRARGKAAWGEPSTAGRPAKLGDAAALKPVLDLSPQPEDEAERLRVHPEASVLAVHRAARVAHLWWWQEVVTGVN